MRRVSHRCQCEIHGTGDGNGQGDVTAGKERECGERGRLRRSTVRARTRGCRGRGVGAAEDGDGVLALKNPLLALILPTDLFEIFFCRESAAMHILELKIPPAVTGAVTAMGMWFVSRALPTFSFVPLRVVAVGMGLTGVAITGSAMLSFWRAHTTANPMNPSSASFLVTSGIYGFTRNPMYLGLLFVLVGWALYLGNALAFLFLPAFILYMNRFQIEPEERALTALFGQEFVAYTFWVRRWI